MDHLQEIYNKATNKEIISLQDALFAVEVFKRREKMSDTSLSNMWEKCLKLAVQKVASILERNIADQVTIQQRDLRYEPKEELTDAERLFQLITNVQFKIKNSPTKPKDRRKEILQNACKDILEPLKEGLITYDIAKDMLIRSCYFTEGEKKSFGKFTPEIAASVIDEVFQAFAPTIIESDENASA